MTARLDAAGGRVQLHGTLADRAWSAPVQLETSKPGQGLDRLWAQARIDDLQARLRRGDDEATLKPQIIRTALAAHLISR
ncbi:hypothetical protein [Oleiagrimonas sp.]|uniref:hypothetical protein n=1 Tax=Oleiagrimonas sp. TaxID=2010330 RepID=UPI002635CF54|nr:hypothetical protein [Oleiagrimonas sp.]MDA3913959.1 hypothetical protein [Oleiagrimonas sp.]